MNRRGFLKALGVGVAGIALKEAIPFNRVWSFPKNIVIADPLCAPTSLYGKSASVNMRLDGLFEGQELPIYSADGSLERGRVRITQINRQTRSVFLEHIPEGTRPGDLLVAMGSLSIL